MAKTGKYNFPCDGRRRRNIFNRKGQDAIIPRLYSAACYRARVISEIFAFELGVARGHLAEAEIRLDSAMQSKSPIAFLREQLDLLPESGRRVRGNYRRRRRLLISLLPGRAAG